MFRLLIVDDEEIIVDGLYEALSHFMPDSLDVYKSYSAKQALDWLTRTRFDIVLTDVRMPGMSGLELSEQIKTYWPNCSIIILTGYSEFEYAYKAIQMTNVRYLLKTEGFSKVKETVREVMQDIEQSQQMSQLIKQSKAQLSALELMAQSDYVRHLISESESFCSDEASLVTEFNKFNIPLDPHRPVFIVLGHLSYPAHLRYVQLGEMVALTKIIWDSYFSERLTSIGVLDKNNDLVWFIQPSEPLQSMFGRQFVHFLEGMLELVQEACYTSLQVRIGFTIAASPCDWTAVTQQYERLRQLQQLKIGDGISMIVRDVEDNAKAPMQELDSLLRKKADNMASHFEFGRKEQFFEELEAYRSSFVDLDGDIVLITVAYYALAVMLLSQINRQGLIEQVGDVSKLMRLQEHTSIQQGFDYIEQIARLIFEYQQENKEKRTSRVIDRICQYIEQHLHEDLSLVRLAEIHFFNPSYLSRLFKQEKNMNLSVYIDASRIHKAKALLEQRDLKVREVASHVGYEAAHSFTRFFKKETGMTPQEYRESISQQGG